MSAYSDLIVATAGLVSYWRLGEASGATADDAVAANNGANTSVTHGVAGAITGDADTAYGFAGGNVIVTTHASLQLTTGSLEFWIKTAAPGAGYRAAVLKRDAYGVYVIDSVLSTYDWGGAGEHSSGENIADDEWHHVVKTFVSASAGNCKVYLDGALVLTTDMTVLDNGNNFAIGSTDAGTQAITATIDEVAVYNAVLSPATISAHYTLGLNGPSSGYTRIRNQFELRPY
jgi:hypothetical protein